VRTVDELIDKPKPVKVLTADEHDRAAYLADLARLKDFTPEVERTRWPNPIGPRWKN
jgi:hypothetical protein